MLNNEVYEQIESVFLKEQKYFTNAMQFLVNEFNSVENVHAIKSRIKDADHLKDKIRRKSTESREINVLNYKDEITDLIGLRILHKFKDEYISIDKYIRSMYGNNFHEQPIAYIREGDDSSQFEGNFQIKVHPAGYRSLHYVINTCFSNKDYKVEIQVRTLFEEAWSEIDHSLRYPSNTDSEVINELLMILNRLSGTSDELSMKIRNVQNVILETNNKLKEIELTNLKLNTNLLNAEQDILIKSNSYNKNDLAKTVTALAVGGISGLILAQLISGTNKT